MIAFFDTQTIFFCNLIHLFLIAQHFRYTCDHFAESYDLWISPNKKRQVSTCLVC